MSAVLVVDDEADLAEALGEVLREDGHEVETARDGLEALASIGRRIPQLVLLDLMLPRLTGGEVLERLRQDGTLDRLRVIVMSAGGTPEVAAAYGCPFLQKPFELAPFLGLVARTLADGPH